MTGLLKDVSIPNFWFIRIFRNFHLKIYFLKDLAMLVDILGYAFLVIFILTALLTLASLPGWVAIPEQYQKVLFRSLILEVVGAIIILFTNNYIEKLPDKLALNQKPDASTWVGLDLDGNLIQPILRIENPDTSALLGSKIPNALARLSKTTYKAELGPQGVILKNQADQILGSLPGNELVKEGLFNMIDSYQGEIAGSANYSLLKYNKNSKDNWVRSGSFLKDSPFSIKVFDLGTKTVYEIRDTQKNEVVFSSSQSSEPLFNVDNRKLHFYQYGSNFYLIRITEADLIGDKMFVHFLQMKFSPVLKLE